MNTTTTNRMRPVHPGEILEEELQELGMSVNALARALCLPASRITTILHGSRAVTSDTALRLYGYFGTGPEIWLNLQKTYELRTAQIRAETHINAMVKPRQENTLPAPFSD